MRIASKYVPSVSRKVTITPVAMVGSPVGLASSFQAPAGQPITVQSGSDLGLGKECADIEDLVLPEIPDIEDCFVPDAPDPIRDCPDPQLPVPGPRGVPGTGGVPGVPGAPGVPGDPGPEGPCPTLTATSDIEVTRGNTETEPSLDVTPSKTIDPQDPDKCEHNFFFDLTLPDFSPSNKRCTCPVMLGNPTVAFAATCNDVTPSWFYVENLEPIGDCEFTIQNPLPAQVIVQNTIGLRFFDTNDILEIQCHESPVMAAGQDAAPEDVYFSLSRTTSNRRRLVGQTSAAVASDDLKFIITDIRDLDTDSDAGLPANLTVQNTESAELATGATVVVSFDDAIGNVEGELVCWKCESRGGGEGGEHPHFAAKLYETLKSDDTTATLTSEPSDYTWIANKPIDPLPTEPNNFYHLEAEAGSIVLVAPDNVQPWASGEAYTIGDQVYADKPGTDPAVVHRYIANDNFTSRPTFDAQEEVNWNDQGPFDSADFRVIGILSKSPGNVFEVEFETDFGPTDDQVTGWILDTNGNQTGDPVTLDNRNNSFHGKANEKGQAVFTAGFGGSAATFVLINSASLAPLIELDSASGLANFTNHIGVADQLNEHPSASAGHDIDLSSTPTIDVNRLAVYNPIDGVIKKLTADGNVADPDIILCEYVNEFYSASTSTVVRPLAASGVQTLAEQEGEAADFYDFGAADTNAQFYGKPGWKVWVMRHGSLYQIVEHEKYPLWINATKYADGQATFVSGFGGGEKALPGTEVAFDDPIGVANDLIVGEKLLLRFHGYSDTGPKYALAEAPDVRVAIVTMTADGDASTDAGPGTWKTLLQGTAINPVPTSFQNPLDLAWTAGDYAIVVERENYDWDIVYIASPKEAPDIVLCEYVNDFYTNDATTLVRPRNLADTDTLAVANNKAADFYDFEVPNINGQFYGLQGWKVWVMRHGSKYQIVNHEKYPVWLQASKKSDTTATSGAWFEGDKDPPAEVVMDDLGGSAERVPNGTDVLLRFEKFESSGTGPVYHLVEVNDVRLGSVRLTNSTADPATGEYLETLQGKAINPGPESYSNPHQLEWEQGDLGLVVQAEDGDWDLVFVGIAPNFGCLITRQGDPPSQVWNVDVEKLTGPAEPFAVSGLEKATDGDGCDYLKVKEGCGLVIRDESGVLEVDVDRLAGDGLEVASSDCDELGVKLDPDGCLELGVDGIAVEIDPAAENIVECRPNGLYAAPTDPSSGDQWRLIHLGSTASLSPAGTPFSATGGCLFTGVLAEYATTGDVCDNNRVTHQSGGGVWVALEDYNTIRVGPQPTLPLKFYTMGRHVGQATYEGDTRDLYLIRELQPADQVGDITLLYVGGSISGRGVGSKEVDEGVFEDTDQAGFSVANTATIDRYGFLNINDQFTVRVLNVSLQSIAQPAGYDTSPGSPDILTEGLFFWGQLLYPALPDADPPEPAVYSLVAPMQPQQYSGFVFDKNQIIEHGVDDDASWTGSGDGTGGGGDGATPIDKYLDCTTETLVTGGSCVNGSVVLTTEDFDICKKKGT